MCGGDGGGMEEGGGLYSHLPDTLGAIPMGLTQGGAEHIHDPYVPRAGAHDPDGAITGAREVAGHTQTRSQWGWLRGGAGDGRAHTIPMCGGGGAEHTRS